MHILVYGQYLLATLTTLLGEFLAVQQQDSKDASEYTKQFKQKQNIMMIQVGKTFWIPLSNIP